jgi:hypothetical protein
MICRVGFEVVYLLLFLPSEYGGPRRLLWGSGSGQIDTNKETQSSRNGLPYKQTPARAHAPIGARTTLVV